MIFAVTEWTIPLSYCIKAGTAAITDNGTDGESRWFRSGNISQKSDINTVTGFGNISIFFAVIYPPGS